MIKKPTKHPGSRKGPQTPRAVEKAVRRSEQLLEGAPMTLSERRARRRFFSEPTGGDLRRAAGKGDWAALEKKLR